MEERSGEFYSKGYCIASNTDCNSGLKGACGVCKIGQEYRTIISQITSEDNSQLMKIIGD